MTRVIVLLAVLGCAFGLVAAIRFFATYHCAEYRPATCTDCVCYLRDADNPALCLSQTCTTRPCQECARWEKDP